MLSVNKPIMDANTMEWISRHIGILNIQMQQFVLPCITRQPMVMMMIIAVFDIVVVAAAYDDDDDLCQQITCIKWEEINYNTYDCCKVHIFVLVKVRKRAKIRNRYNQAPHLTQDINGKVTMSQLDITSEIQEVSPFPAGGHKASINRRTWKHNKRRHKWSTKEAPPWKGQ